MNLQKKSCRQWVQLSAQTERFSHHCLSRLTHSSTSEIILVKLCFFMRTFPLRTADKLCAFYTLLMSSVTIRSPLWRMTPSSRTRFLCWSFLKKWIHIKRASREWQRKQKCIYIHNTFMRTGSVGGVRCWDRRLKMILAELTSWLWSPAGRPEPWHHI